MSEKDQKQTINSNEITSTEGISIYNDLILLQQNIQLEFDSKPIKEIGKKTKHKNRIEIAEKDTVLKSKKIEKKKLRVINRLIAGEINGPRAAKLLKLSTRQIRNLKRQVLEQGDEGVIHKNRYNKPVNTYDADIRKQLAQTYRKEFRGTNFTEFARIMQERGYDLSRSTIYNILRENRIRSPQRKTVKRKTQTTNIVKKV